MGEFGLFIAAAIPALIVSVAGRLIQRKRYSAWKNALFGGLLIAGVTAAVTLGYRGSVEQSIAECRSAPPGTTYDCEDEYLVLAFFLLMGGVALVEHLLFSVLLKLTAPRVA